MTQCFRTGAPLRALRVVLLISLLLVELAGGIQPVSAASPPVITEGDSVTRTISRNGTPYAFDLTLHATDPDIGDILTWSIATSALHGTASASGTGPSVVVTYTPTTDYAGLDSFVVMVDDGTGSSDSIQVYVTVAPGIGMVTDVAGIADKGFNWLSYQGLVRAETELGITKRLYTPASPSGYLTKLLKCADDGNQLCFGVGFALADAIKAAAVARQDTAFAIIDFQLSSPPPNLRGLVFTEKEVGFLAGALAGKMTRTKVIGVVGGMNVVPAVVSFVEGYRNGAQCANPNVKVLIRYAGTFSNPALGAQIAQQMIGQKADVIFGAAGPTGNGAVLYSAQHDRWSIGVDTDQYLSLFRNGTVAGSAKLLSSAMKRVDNAVYTTVEDYMTGAFSAGTVTFNLAEEGVGLAPFHKASTKIPLATKTYLDTLKVGIISGSIDVNDSCRFKTKSSGAQDGWILEATETSEMGGSMNPAATTLLIGDNAQDQQYRSILSFDTSAIPDDAVITKVQLKIRRAGLVGTNPFTTHSGLKFDIQTGDFSTNAALELTDFEAAASMDLAGSFGSILASGWYRASPSSDVFSFINKQGHTQFRLRFFKDDNDDMSADYLKIYSGDAALAYQPQLIISYRQP